MSRPIARGLALFFAGFTLLNLTGSLVSPGFDANIWWIDIAFMPTCVLAVSHFYHLPRVKMTYSRALFSGPYTVEVFTVPAEDRAVMSRLPWYMTREIAALWSYYLRPLGV